MEWLIDTLIWLPAIIIGLTFHEYAHGKVADRLGDDTPYYQGRLTLNPLPHIDWVGFFMLLFFKFGWAKPVIVNPLNFKKVGVKRGMMLVSLAGPVMNIFIAFVSMILYKYLLLYSQAEGVYLLIALLVPLIQINLILAAFNLIPIPPLDGSKILAGLLSDQGAETIYSLEQYGPLILLLLIVTGLVGKLIWPLVTALFNLLAMVVGI